MVEIRSFIAIDLPSALKAHIGEIQQALRSAPSDVRWVRPEGLHYTLKFLGMISEDTLPVLSSVIAQCTADIRPFSIVVRSLGAFPHERNPKVIWIGAEDTSGMFSVLFHTLETALATIGFKEERRPFTPHLTLGRVASPTGKKALAQKLEQYKNCECGECEVHEVVLFKSELTPRGARYTRLNTFPLSA